MELQPAPATTQGAPLDVTTGVTAKTADGEARAVTMTLPEFRRAVLANLAQATDAKARPAGAVCLQVGERTHPTPCPPHTLGLATPLQTEGNTLFAAGELKAAEEKYVAALELVGAALSVPALSARPDMGDLLTRVHSLHAACHLNLAAVAHKARGCVGGCVATRNTKRHGTPVGGADATLVAFLLP